MQFYDFSDTQIYLNYKLLSYDIVSINKNEELVSACDPSRDAWFFISMWLGHTKSLRMITDGDVWYPVILDYTKRMFVLDHNIPMHRPPPKPIIRKLIKQIVRCCFEEPN